MTEPSHRRRKVATATALGLTGALALGGLTLLGGTASTASSHREAPQIASDPQADNTDTYAFVSPDKQNTVTLLANWLPFQDPNGGPNFYPFSTDARYNINVDNSGDGVADITYRWEFRNDDKRGNKTFLYNNGPVGKLKDPNLLFKQRYTLTRVTDSGEKVLIKDGIAAPSFTGKASMPNYGKLRSEATRGFDKGKGAGKTYAGAADDSFALDLRVFDLLYGANLSETGQDTLKGYNVNTLAVQIPKNALALKGDAKRNPVIGVWSTTERRSANVSVGGSGINPSVNGDDEKNEACGTVSIAGVCPFGTSSNAVSDAGGSSADAGWTQVSRLGNPLINEVVTAAGMKDQFNRSNPADDGKWDALVNRILKPEVPQLIEGIYGLKAPKGPRTDLLQIFGTGIAKSTGPIKADLNAHILNKDAVADRIVPSEQLRLNMSVPVTKSPNRLGVLAGDFQGFPNGRRLVDDVVDIEIQALMGAAKSGKIVKALAAGDGVNGNNRGTTSRFPYIPGPNERAVNTQ